ncbi:PTS sugar transporter subunit IIA [Caviibacter abscessus]|uniref:PTS sugar transporter subunit IIA n=1 Tax=Caviibacter abscessus TaxID=1766719 RepID=UPI0009EA2429|nr:PTS sugar transporter subunit IIA [Caviibacter abscessus]
MFNKNNTIILDKVSDWRESIKEASNPLIKNGNINWNYVDKIIENINKFGFYIVLDEYVAIPHARPEDGVCETGISFLKLNNSVLYGNEKVYLIFVIAAKNAD